MRISAAHRREAGQAMVGVIMVSLVLALLITGILAVALHSNDSTVRDRSRTQGVQSAESAVSVLIDGLTRNLCVPDVGLPTPVQITVSGRSVGQYQAIVRLPDEAGVITPSTWNPNQTSGAGCTTAPPVVQDRVITAWGYGPSATSTRRVLRKVQANVRVAPLVGFRFTCFAGGTSPDGILTISNNMVVNGNCYARSMSSTNNNLTENGTLMTPGSVTTKNNGVYNGSVWAGGNVTIGNNTTITGYVTSAAGAIHLNQNAKILGNATAGTTITLDNNASISGTRCPATTGAPGCPTTPPPTLTMPVLRCAATDLACWTTLFPGIVSTSSSAMSTWLTTNKNALTGSFYVNDSSSIDFTGGGTITGPLTIITKGKIEMSRDLVTADATVPPTACTPAGGSRTCQVTILSTNTANDAIYMKSPNSTANPATISVLLYTLGTLKTANGSKPTFSGAMYAANIDSGSNGITVTQSQDLVDFPPPIVDWSLSLSSAQYAVINTGWRELTPAPPV